MFDIFEKPWALIGLAVIVLFIVLTYRSIIPEKRRWWQWLIPLLIIGAAFGFDKFVQTDRENIEDILDAGIQAVEDENFNSMYSYLSDDYSDSLHSTKEHLIDHAQRKLNMNVVEKCKRTSQPLITFSGNKAKANLFFQIVLSKDSPVSQIYPVNFFEMRVDIGFIKENDNWKIDNIEISKINQQTARWRDIG